MKRVSLTIPNDLLNYIDEKRNGIPRSRYISNILREVIERRLKKNGVI